MLKELVRKAAADNEALSILIDRFDKLLRKYAKLLAYEDAHADMLVSFIALVKGFNTDHLNTDDEAVIVSYIAVSVKNEYIRLSKDAQKISTTPFSSLDDNFLYYVEVKLAERDNYGLLWDDLQSLLTGHEYEIFCFLARGYSVAEIAKLSDSSRQAVNQAKNRALTKLRNIWNDGDAA
jgi:DNA-directed RNA polymerase specialized sigma24 family protein